MTVDAVRGTTALQVQPLTCRIGAELTGVRLADATDGDVAAIRKALLDHRVVFFRDQDLSGEEHVAFARRLGPLTRSHPTLPGTGETAELFDLDSIAGAAANHWHTDVTFVDRPPTFSVLRALIIPEVGGDTLWANTVAAYRDLPADLRTLADCLRAVHTNGQDYGRVDVNSLRKKLSPTQLEYVASFVAEVFETEHPVVRIHPETGERALLLGGFAQKLVGHPTAQTAALHQIFQSYVTRPENCVRWRYREGDVVIWDNRATQHYAVYDYGRQRRRVQRVTTAGELVTGLDGTTTVALKGDSARYYAPAT